MSKITIAIFLLVTVNVALAQSTDSTSYEHLKIFSAYEVVIGGGLLKNSGHLMRYFEQKYGYSIGIGAYHTFTKSFQLNVRMTYDYKGSSAAAHSSWSSQIFDNPNILGYSMESDFHYFTLTALPTFSIGHRKNIILGGGFFYSVLRDIKTKEYETLSSGPFIAQSFSSSNAKWDGETDMGICFFTGYKFRMIKNGVGTVQLFYNNSLHDIDLPFGGWQRNRSLMLMFSASILNR